MIHVIGGNQTGNIGKQVCRGFLAGQGVSGHVVSFMLMQVMKLFMVTDVFEIITFRRRK